MGRRDPARAELDRGLPCAQVFSFDDEDRCVRVQEFYGREAALRAAGLDAPEG